MPRTNEQYEALSSNGTLERLVGRPGPSSANQLVEGQAIWDYAAIRRPHLVI